MSRRTHKEAAILKREVKRFWNDKPLFAGESRYEPGSREYFLAHEGVYLSDVFPSGTIAEEYFPFAPGGRTLDVGCGPGFWTRQLAKRGYRTFCVDMSETAVGLTRRSLALFDIEASATVADAERLPFSSDSFDGIVSHGVIHHTPDTQACLHEMFRVLVPDGRVVVSVYFRNMILRSRILSAVFSAAFSGYIRLAGRGREALLASGDPEEIVRRYDGISNPVGKSYTREEFVAMVRSAGFHVEQVWRLYVPLRALGAGKVLRPFHDAVSRRFGLMICVCARKPS